MIPAMLDAHFSLLNYAFYSKNYHPIIIENEEGITDIGLKYVNNEMCYPAILNKKEEKIMLKNERKIVDILIKYSDYLFVLAITILSIYIRNFYYKNFLCTIYDDCFKWCWNYLW